MTVAGPLRSNQRSGKHFRPRPPKAGEQVVSGGRRAILTLTDQGFSSISNFVVGVAIARGAGAAALGGFSVAYAGWLVLAAMHRALVTDPMAIEGDVRSHEVATAIRAGFAAEVLLGLVGGAAFALGGLVLMLAHQATFGFAMLVLAPWLVALLVQDYWRWIGFMTRKPGRALANDAVFNCVQSVAFLCIFVMRYHDEAALISAWGVGALAGMLFGLRQYRVLPTLRGGWGLLRTRWRVSRWIASSSLISWGASQSYIVIAAAVLGPVGLGGLKAAQTLVSGPSGVLIQAGGSIGLPEASRAYAEKGWNGLIRVARIVALAGVVSFAACAAGVVLWGRQLLVHIYGPAFGQYQVAAVLFGIGYIFVGFYLGPILVVKATRRTQWLMVGQTVCLVVSVISTTVLCLVMRVDGAALASLVTYAAAAAVFRWAQSKVARDESVLKVRPTAGDDKTGHPERLEDEITSPTETAGTEVAVAQSSHWRNASDGGAEELTVSAVGP